MRYVTALLLLSTALWAATVAGKWKGTVTADGDSSEMTLALEVSGTRVKGTAGDKDSHLAIQNGAIDGNKITFRVVVPSGNGIAFDYDLTLDGDVLRGTVTMKLGDQPRVGTAEFHRDK